MDDKELRARAIEALTTPGPSGFAEIPDDTELFIRDAEGAAGEIFDCIAPLIAERVRAAQEQAWNEGCTAGHRLKGTNPYTVKGGTK